MQIESVYGRRASCSLSRTLVFCVLLIGVLCGSPPAVAEPVPYRVIGLQSSVQVDDARHTEVEILFDSTSNLDVVAGTSETSDLTIVTHVRELRLNDPGLDGIQLRSLVDSLPAPCATPPCLASLTQTGRLLTTQPGPFGAGRGVLAPNDEFFAAITVDGFTVSQRENASIAANLYVRKPTSLALGDLAGSYSVFAYSSILAARFDESSEMHVVDELQITFAGDGTCSGGSLGLIESLQVTEWPDLASRETTLAKRESGVTADGCGYSVDGATGTVTLMLTFTDEGESETVSVPLYVSAEGRYLTGSLSFTDVDGGETAHEHSFLVGVRADPAPTNQTITGVFLLSMIGEQLQGEFNGGSDIDFGARYALSFSGLAGDAEGYSQCTVIGSTLAGVRRRLSGIVANAENGSSTYGDTVVPAYSECRYRANGSGVVDLELRNSGASWVPAVMRLSDDAATLIGGTVTTSAASLPPEVPTPLPVGGFSRAWIGIAQQAETVVTSAEVEQFLLPFIFAADSAITLASSVLPSSRSVVVDSPATAFSTVINAGTVDAYRCQIRPASSVDVGFSYQETDPATNMPVGFADVPLDIPAGQSQSFVFTVTPRENISQLEFELEFACANSGAAATSVGINTLLLSASTTPPADVIALAATVQNNGIVTISTEFDNGAFSLATVNVGAEVDAEFSVDTGSAVLPVALSLCQTDPATSNCINPTVPTTDPVMVNVPNGATPTFGVFVSGTQTIPFDPSLNRVFLRIRDEGGVVRGATSVAVRRE